MIRVAAPIYLKTGGLLPPRIVGTAPSPMLKSEQNKFLL